MGDAGFFLEYFENHILFSTFLKAVKSCWKSKTVISQKDVFDDE